MRITSCTFCRVAVELKQIGLRESLPRPPSIPMVWAIVTGPLLGHPSQMGGLWLFYNQRTSLLASFQEDNKPEKGPQCGWCCLRVYYQALHREMAACCLPAAFILTGAGAPLAGQRPGEMWGKGKEVTPCWNLEFWSSYLIKSSINSFTISLFHSVHF